MTNASRPELRALVLEASQALAQLDAERLEELALCCQALRRDLPAIATEERLSLRQEARAAAPAMTAFAGILDATRANLQVMHRLRAAQRGEIEYGGWARSEHPRGHD